MSSHINQITPHTFHPFPRLPYEIRLQVWASTLPGPRIVYLQRLRHPSQPAPFSPSPLSLLQATPTPIQTYFSTPAHSNAYLASLSRICHESRSVILSSYTLLAPPSFLSSPPLYFSPALDILYLDFGRLPTLPYNPTHFTSLSPLTGDNFLERYIAPPISASFASSVRHLAIHNNGYKRYMGPDLSANVLKVFPNLRVLVLADQLHGREEAGEELVFLRGDVGEIFDPEREDRNSLEDDEAHLARREREEKAYELGRQLLLWRDRPVYSLTPLTEETSYRTTLSALTTPNPPTPLILKRSITTSRVKNALLSICSTEARFQLLEGLDWGFVVGTHAYAGGLDLDQQISYLELALERLSTKLINDSQGVEIEGGFVGNVWDFWGKIEDLKREREMLAVVLREAEEQEG